MHIAWRGRQKLDGCERSISLAAGRTREGRLARRLDRAYLVQVAQAEPEQFRADKTNGKVLIGRQPMYLEVVPKTKHSVVTLLYYSGGWQAAYNESHPAAASCHGCGACRPPRVLRGHHGATFVPIVISCHVRPPPPRAAWARAARQRNLNLWHL